MQQSQLFQFKSEYGVLEKGQNQTSNFTFFNSAFMALNKS